MSIPKSEHKVYIYKNDYNAMCTEVYKYQRIETGGNLFGLWTTSGSAVIHVVPGPGMNCKRTTTSFHQDIEYMYRVGRLVNDNYMLCHIGDWHSRHSLSSNRPSAGDEQTVRRNFPQGVTKFLVIIANIKNGDTILLSPYFFIDGGRRYEKAEFEVLDCDSPFSTDFKIMEQIDLGAEHQRHKTALVERASHRGEPSRNTRNRQNTRSNPERSGNASSTCVQANQRSTLSIHDANSLIPQVDAAKANSNQIISNAQAYQSQFKWEDISAMDTEDSDLIPRDDDISSSSEISPSESETITPVASLPEPDRNKNDDDDEKPSEKEIVLKKIYVELKYWFGNEPNSIFKFETSSCPGAIEIRFKHNYKYWMIRFPADFPATPAKLFHTSENSVRFNECAQFDLVEPLNDEVNILLTVKNICGPCKICKKFTKESLSRADFNLRNIDKLADFAHKFVVKLDKYFPDVTECNISHPSDTSHATIRFKHGTKWWIINIPALFPDAPAKVYHQSDKESSQQHDVLLYGNNQQGPQVLDTPQLIINAINCNCFCSKCEKAHERRY